MSQITITSNGSSPSKSHLKENGMQNQTNTLNNGRLTGAEKMEKGSIPWGTYHIYIKSAGGYILALIVLLIFILNVFVTGKFRILLRFFLPTFYFTSMSIAFSSWWLAHWLNVGVAVRTFLRFSLFYPMCIMGSSQIWQNATRMIDNETEYYMSVTSHPDLQYYQAIYGGFIIVILLTSLLRTFVFMKVLQVEGFNFKHYIFSL